MKNSMRYLVGLAAIGAAMTVTPLYAMPMANEPINIVSGGIGDGGRGAIEQIQGNYSAKFVFVGEAGIYLADVNVQVTDRKGNEIFTAVSDGPFMLADLPAGKYTVIAEIAGFTEKKNISLGGGLKTYHFRFPIKDDVPRDNWGSEPMAETPAPAPIAAEPAAPRVIHRSVEDVLEERENGMPNGQPPYPVKYLDQPTE